VSCAHAPAQQVAHSLPPLAQRALAARSVQPARAGQAPGDERVSEEGAAQLDTYPSALSSTKSSVSVPNASQSNVVRREPAAGGGSAAPRGGTNDERPLIDDLFLLRSGRPWQSRRQSERRSRVWPRCVARGGLSAVPARARALCWPTM